MLRARRYRIFLAIALFVVLALYHFSSLPSWERTSTSKISVENLANRPKRPPPPQTPLKPAAEAPIAEKVPSAAEKDKPAKPPSVVVVDGSAEKPVEHADKESAVETTSVGHASTDIAKPVVDLTTFHKPGIEEELIQQGQGRLEPPTKGGAPDIHWTKLPEHFPVASGSIIPLPTGKPKDLPKIQLPKYPTESAEDKADREAKQDAVRAAFKHSWKGYRERAWMQDELRPVSGEARNPFCGWSATLVDSLDTMWVMGLKDEFNQAVEAIQKIDFTTNVRNEIPVFETTIRYLGGLLGAYDVSGGTSRGLVDKAVELAEVLMGAFDTPNRMPMLFYQWKPTFASQPHRAPTRAVLSELGSLSMEFTRLAQITKEDKYYDAIARITNELEKWQMKTKLPGMWPVAVDTSGCNKTILTWQKPRDDLHTGALPPYVKNAKRQLYDATLTNVTDPSPIDDRVPLPTSALTGTVVSGETDCEPQGLASPSYSSREQFTMGALSDSVYEYMPKMHMLLGGLTTQYKAMYADAVQAIKPELLYRPMAPNGTNVLLSGKLEVTDVADMAPKTLNPVGTHLTCFVGGLFGVGAKIFARADEIDIASKLTDGCIWAYESTVTGIMPEEFAVVPCADRSHCPWNETLWHDSLDPFQASRAPPPPAQQKVVSLDEGEQKDEYAVKAKRQGFEETFDTTAKKPAAGPGSPAIPKADSPAAPPTPASGRPPAGLHADNPDYAPPPPPTHEEYVANRIHDERLPPGFTALVDKRYILRPEAIESVFIMYRITGDKYYREKGWRMFTSIQRQTRTEWGHAAVMDVTSDASVHDDQMESFWLAETLKYFYLLFADESVVSLDDFVLNTEAHPFKRPTV